MTLDLFRDEAVDDHWLLQLENLAPEKAIEGLIAVAGYNPLNRSPEEVVVVERAAIYGAQFVFFEKGRNGRAPIAQAFVFVSDGDDDEKFAGIHQRLWSWGGVPLLYRRTPSQIQIFRCAHDPDFMLSTGNPICKPFQALDIGARIAKAEAWWQAERLQNGTLWDDPVICNTMLSAQKGAHRTLVEAIRRLNDDLNSKRILPAPLRRRLIILSLLIAYLEERGVLGPDFFEGFLSGAEHFFEVLRDGNAMVAMLENLEERFNGNVFRLEDHEIAALKTSRQLDRFAKVIEGLESENGQLNFWRLYSFKDLPIELISHIYQLFVADTESSVYTPPALVRLMLEEALSWKRIDQLIVNKQIILDPACGSGIFLVEAYKRLVLHWRSRHDWARPGVAVLRKLLEHIHGIDLEPGAVELAAFSLCLALCDALEPAEIRASVKLFPKLAETNIIEDCFFDAKDSNRITSSVGVLVGNPPFESTLTTSGAERAYDNYLKHDKLADRQLAYLFLHEAMSLLADDGILAMIQPAGFLYNQNSSDFRALFFKNWNVREILDFVSTRGLFKKGKADPQVVIVLAEPISQVPTQATLHAVFRRNGRAQAEQGFEIDYYDLHRVSRTSNPENSDVWRANLLGGERMLAFVKRLRQYRTVGEYAESRGWDVGEGFIPARKDLSRPNAHLLGQPFLPTNALSKEGLNEEMISEVTDQYFDGPRSPSRFTPPMLLIKKHEDLYNAIWEKKYLTYKNEIVGFAVPKSELEKLKRVEKWLNDNAAALKAYVAGISIRMFTKRATSIANVDITSIPFPEEGTLDLSVNEEILVHDVVRHLRNFVRRGSDSEIAKRGAQRDLPAFSETFVSQINTVYPKIPLIPLEPQFWPGIICQPFVFGDGKVDWSGAAELRGRLDHLLREQRGSSITIVRIARLYERNFVFLLKPDRLRYWLRSIALRDADDVLTDLRSQGF
jgi:hypothetical protein